MKRGGSRKRGGSGPPDPPPSGHAYDEDRAYVITKVLLIAYFQKYKNNTNTSCSNKVIFDLNLCQAVFPYKPVKKNATLHSWEPNFLYAKTSNTVTERL